MRPRPLRDAMGAELAIDVSIAVTWQFGADWMGQVGCCARIHRIERIEAIAIVSWWWPVAVASGEIANPLGRLTLDIFFGLGQSPRAWCIARGISHCD